MKKNINGSAIIVVIVTAIVFLVYTASTYSDILHLKTMHEKYFSNIEQILDEDYQYQKTNI